MERIKKIINKYQNEEDYKLFKETVDMLSKNGIGKGVFQNYTVLCDVIEILTISETLIKEKI